MKKYLKSLGDFNTMPLPYRPCTVDDFIHQMHYEPELEYRQIMQGRKLQTMWIYWFHDCAIACEMPQKWHCEASKVVYDDPIKYYRIGCEHKWSSVKIGNCLHRDTCELCGLSFERDSSG